jgi:BirA family biotin operon repressor/biotin-[acetyl-CoA-carboxylase] ligase
VTDVRAHVLRRLGAGGTHAGAAIAAELGVSRAAVAKQVARLREFGWAIDTTVDGYCLDPGHRPLDEPSLRQGLALLGDRIECCEILQQVDSTSDHLARSVAPEAGRVQVCIAESQQAGRGRRGRAWHARPGASITFSVAAVLPLPPPALAGLSLAAGITCAEVLAAHGIDAVRVKWPNDLQVDGAKLGGLLVEISGESGGPSRVILGVGVNHHLGDAIPDTGMPVTDIVRSRPDAASERTGVTVDLVAACIRLLDRFPGEGLAGWAGRWARFDALAGREVELDTPGGPVRGTASGIAPDGALRIRGPRGEQCFHSGEVSVRPVP